MAAEFARTFPGTAVCDLTKELLNAYMASHSDVTARTRNGRRRSGHVSEMVRARGLPRRGHRLMEADGMAHEDSEPEAIEFYTPTQLSDLLRNRQRADRAPASASGDRPRRTGRAAAARGGAPDLGGRVPGEGPCRGIPDQEQDPRATAGDCLPSSDAMARALPRLLRPAMDQWPGRFHSDFGDLRRR